MKKRKVDDIVYEVGSDNVFADLELDNPSEELAKAELVRAICFLVADRAWKQVDAARCLGIPQSKVSVLLRGRTGGFSTQKLMVFLNRLGQDVEIRIKPKPKQRAIPRLDVLFSGSTGMTRSKRSAALG